MPILGRKREPAASPESAPGTGGPREEAADLRARAAAIRTELEHEQQEADDAQRALEERRETGEASNLDAQAAELDLEQDRRDMAAELRAQAEAAERQAVELDACASELDGDLLGRDARARHLEQQLAEVGPRRESLQRAASEAAGRGDTDAILDAERELALLPAVEQRLAEQVDIANTDTVNAATRAAEVEVEAYETRRGAGDLRRWADTDALAIAPPPLPDVEHTVREREAMTVREQTAARMAALRAIRDLPDPDDRDAGMAVLARESETRAAAQAASFRAGDVETLDQLARLVANVRDAAAAEADRWLHAPIDMRHAGPIATKEREQLNRVIAVYRARLGRDLPSCRELATADGFGLADGRLLPDRFAADAAEAATTATAELANERETLGVD